MMWSIIKFKISNYPIDLKPKNKAELISAIQKEWRAIDISTVNRLVSSFKDRLNTCIHVGGQTIAPYLKHHLFDLSKIEMEEPPYVFNDEVDQYLLQNSQQSWKKTGSLLQLNPNLVKYRTNYLQYVQRNVSTPKVDLLQINRNFIPKKIYPIPHITGYMPKDISEQEENLVIDAFPIISYIDDESDDSEEDYSE